MIVYINVSQLKFIPESFSEHNFLKEMISAVLDKNTVKLMEYRRLMKNPKYRQLCCNSYAKYIGLLAQ